MGIKGQEAAEAPDLLDVTAVARKLCVGTRTVLRLRDSGALPRPFKIGRLVRWRRVDIDHWIAADCRPVETR